METYVPLPYPGRLPSRLTKVYLKWLEDRDVACSRLGLRPYTDEECRAKKEELWEQMCYDSWVEGQMKAMKEKGYTSVMGEKSSKYFVTINPRADTPIESLVKTVDKWVKQKYIKTVQYVYEQGSDTIEGAGHHPHVHAIVEADVNEKSVLGRTASTFKNLIGDKASIDIKRAHGNSEAYILGDKKDDKKKQKVLVDVYWRNINNLSEIYNIKNGHNEKETCDQKETNETCVQTSVSDDSASDTSY